MKTVIKVRLNISGKGKKKKKGNVRCYRADERPENAICVEN